MRVKSIALCAAALSLVVGSPTSSSAITVRTDVVDENYVTGYLYWENGKGGISWNERHAGDDNVDPGTRSVGQHVEFVAEPLPRTLYLNVSRVIQLDLFFQGTGPPSEMDFDIEIYADASFLTGGITFYNDAIRYGDPKTCPSCAPKEMEPRAAGYTVVSHRMQAELETLSQGSILSLRVVHRDPDAYTYGFQGDHASVLRLGVFSPEDVLYRVPKYAYEGQRPQEEGAAREVDPVTDLMNQVVNRGILVAGALAPARFFGGQSGRRQGKRAVLVLVLAASGLSGCVGVPNQSSANEPESYQAGLGGSADQHIVRDTKNETGLSNTSRGSILGLVSDTDNLPVNGAYVILLGTPRSVVTSPNGRFQFVGLAPGGYGLRVDRDGFKPFETRISVEAESITKVEVQLDFLHPEARDQRPHRHEYWFDTNGKRVDSIMLFDQPLETVSGGIATGGEIHGTILLKPPITILPGTIDIEINVTWSGGGKVRLQTQRPDDGPNTTQLYDRSSGFPFHLRTTWEMTDPGHASYTYWGSLQFEFDNPCVAIVVYETHMYDPRCPPPGYHVRIAVHRGVIPLEPAHKDYWGATTNGVAVIENETKPLGAPDCYYDPLDRRPLCPVGTRFSQISGNTEDRLAGDRPFNASWQPTGFLPFETTWVELRLQVSRETRDSLSNPPWALFYRDAESPNFGDCSPKSSFNRDASLRIPLQSSGASNLEWDAKLSLQPGQADSPYAKRTNWCFFVAPADQNAQMNDYLLNNRNLPLLTLTVVGHKDAMPKS